MTIRTRPLTRPLAALAGGLFAVTAAVDIPHDQATEFVGVTDYVLEGFFAASLIASCCALVTLLSAASGWAARLGWSVSLLGTGTLAVVVTATFVSGGEVLDTAFVVAMLGMFLGYLILLGADLAKRVVPRFAGLALALSIVATMAVGEDYGVLAWSAGWFAVAALAATPVRERETAGAAS